MQVVLTSASLGRRVSLRVRLHSVGPLPDEQTAGHSDLVGTLIELSELQARLLTRHGPVQVLLSDVVAARLVGAARRDVLALQRIAADGWRAAELRSIDGWMLRANSGWSRRANSVLPLGQLQRPLAAALDEIASWYATRELPALVCLPLAARGLLDAELGRRQWAAEAQTVVLSRPLPTAGPPTARHEVRLETAPSASWFRACGDLPPAARQLLTRHPAAVFASISLQDQVVGIARGACDGGWVGISAVQVRPEFRRRGAATSMITALLRWAAGRGATNGYLHVDADNHAGQALYHQLGFSEHHRYHYRRMP